MTEVNPCGQAAKTFDAEKIDSEKLDAEKLDSEKFYTEKHAQGAEECAHGGYVRSGYVQGESVQEKYAQKRARKFAAIDQQARASLAKIAPNPSRFCAKGAAGEANSAVKFAALTGSEIGSLPTVAADDIPQIFAAAREAGTHWRNVGFKERKRILSRFADEVLKFREEILDVLQWENGKSRGSAYEEVYDVLTNTLYYAKYAEKFLRPRSVSGAVPILTRACVQYQPKGAVAVISPWNYPLTLAISDAAAALMAGNTVVLKPDSLTPYSAIAAAALLARAGLPSGVFQIVIGSGRELGPAMIAECDYMMFTGSTATGKEIGALAGAQLVGYSAELGGKNAMIVRADAPVKRAAKAAAKASFASSGQLCVSMERIYIRSEIWDEFVSEFVRVTNKLKVDAALDWKSDIGPLISDTQVTKVLSHVQDAVAKGAQVLAGGELLPQISQRAVAPTILTGVTPQMKIYAEETFGPVVSLYRVESDEEALRLVNNTRYGLNSAVWTGDLRAGEALAARINAGSVNVNDGYAAAWGSIAAPSGGMKDSGVGHRHGPEGILKYCDVRTVAVQKLMHLAAPKWLGEKTWTRLLSGYVQLRRGVRR